MTDETDSEIIEIRKEQLDELVEQKVEQTLEAKREKYSRRSVLASIAGMAGAGALGVKYGTARGAANPADAAGTVYFEQIGSEDYPVTDFWVETEHTFNSSEAFSDVDITNSLNSGGVIVDGDGVFRDVWVIAAGASDPTDAEADDLILEEES